MESVDIFIDMMSPEFQQRLHKAGVNPNLYRQEPRQLPNTSRYPDMRSSVKKKKIDGSSARPESGPLNIGPLEEFRDPTSRIEAIETKTADDSLKLIYDWVQKKSISYDEFEEFLAEVFHKVIKSIK